MLTDECLAKWTASCGCRHLRGDAVGDGEKRLVLDSWAETPERGNAPQRSKALRPRRPLRPWRGILEALTCAKHWAAADLIALLSLLTGY
jgi:hypothetical protein